MKIDLIAIVYKVICSCKASEIVATGAKTKYTLNCDDCRDTYEIEIALHGELISRGISRKE